MVKKMEGEKITAAKSHYNMVMIIMLKIWSMKNYCKKIKDIVKKLKELVLS